MSPPPTVTSEATGADRARWFTEEVQPHGPSLKTYLRRSFPRMGDEVEDVVQESYLRLWQYQPEHPIRSARAFLFRVAQRVALSLVRRGRRSPVEFVGNLHGLDAVEDGSAAADTLDKEEKVRLLIDAIDVLPARCREVVILRKLKLLPQREVALRLGISEKGVENQLARGLDRCRAYLRRRGVNHFLSDAR